jgi:hypothetical protein
MFDVQWQNVRGKCNDINFITRTMFSLFPRPQAVAKRNVHGLMFRYLIDDNENRVNITYFN